MLIKGDNILKAVWGREIEGVWRVGKKEWQSSRHYKLLISAECFIKCQSASPWARHWKMAALWCAGTSPAALCVCVCACVCVRERERGRESISVCVQVCACLCVCVFTSACVCPCWPPSHVAVKQNRVADCPLLCLPLCQYNTILFQPVIFTCLALSKAPVWTEEYKWLTYWV